MYRILVINTGSTSTKIAVYEGDAPVLEENIEHSAEELKGCVELLDQYPIRRSAVIK